MTIEPADVRPMSGSSVAAPVWMRGRWLVAWAGLLVVAMLVALGVPPVQRTQEARVLETAREMLDGPQREWLLPELNGETRLRKPPLAYWMSAVAFSLGGVGEFAGRAPTALLSCLTVAIAFLAADRLLGRRSAFFGAAMLAGSYLFFRHSRLAETDAPAATFVTGAIYCMLRAADVARGDRRQIGWLHAAATGMGLAMNAKGLPGLFPLGFLLAYAATMRRWDVLRRFVTTGAVLTFLIISGAWYVYAAATIGPKQFIQELLIVTKGENHDSPFYNYIWQLLVAAMPWVCFAVVGVVGAIARWRSDARLRVLLVWFGSILLPLCLIRNRQFHYLVPALPPLMLLAGWAMDLACGRRSTFRRGEMREADAEKDLAPRPGIEGMARSCIPLTLIGAALGGIGVVVAGRAVSGAVRSADVLLGAIIVIATLAMVVLYRRRSRVVAMTAFTLGVLAVMPAVVGVWIPSIDDNDPRLVARQIRARFGDGPYRFFGHNMSLPLVFNLRTIIPLSTTRERLLHAARETPGLIVIAQSKDGRAAPQLEGTIDDVQLKQELHLVTGDQQFDLYRTTIVSGPTTAPAP